MTTESSESYDLAARSVIEQALGRTFDGPEEIPRRDAFVRDATDLLSKFIAERSGNPGFHSARFFDAVVAISAARDRIKEAARRSRVVERLIDAQRKISELEARVVERDQQLQGLAKGDVGPIASALVAAEGRLTTVESELIETRSMLAAEKARREAASSPQPAPPPPPPHAQPEPRIATPREVEPEGDPARTVRLAFLDGMELADDIEDRAGAPPPPPPPPPAPPTDELPQRRAVVAETARVAAEADRELAELERDSLRAQLEQIVEREKLARNERNTLKLERDELADRIAAVDREGSAHRTELERERNDAIRARIAAETARRDLEEELAHTRNDTRSLQQALADRDVTKRRSTDEVERAHDARARAEEAVAREAQASLKARRERDELKAERDRLRASHADMTKVKDRHAALLAALGIPPDLAPERLEDELARRREIVFVHEPPAWDEAARRLSDLRDRGPLPAAAEARARLDRLASLKERYETLRAQAASSNARPSELLELARIVATQEDEARWLSTVEAIF